MANLYTVLQRYAPILLKYNNSIPVKLEGGWVSIYQYGEFGSDEFLGFIQNGNGGETYIITYWGSNITVANNSIQVIVAQGQKLTVVYDTSVLPLIFDTHVNAADKIEYFHP